MADDLSGSTVTYDPDTGTYRVTHDFASQYDISTTLIIALEEVAEIESIQLSQPLYDVVDPDGLARLFEPIQQAPRDGGEVTFTIDDFDVTVHGSGAIVIAPSQGA